MFSPRISFSVVRSIICSASIFLSLAFSASSAFSFLASDTYMPPYIKGRIVDTVLVSQIFCAEPCLVLLQNANDLFLSEPCSLHHLSPLIGTD